MYAGCRNQLPKVSTYVSGWTKNQSTIGNATAVAALAALNASRRVSRPARARPVTTAVPAIKLRSAPEGCAHAQTTNAAAATASHPYERTLANLVTATSESTSGGMTHTPSTAPLLADATYAGFDRRRSAATQPSARSQNRSAANA